MALIQATNLITKKELLTTDPDTEDKQLIYEITNGPRNGYVENKLKPGTAVTTFTQGTEDELYFVAFCLQLLHIVKVAGVKGGKMVGGAKTRGKILSRTSLTSGESYTAQSGECCSFGISNVRPKEVNFTVDCRKPVGFFFDSNLCPAVCPVSPDLLELEIWLGTIQSSADFARGSNNPKVWEMFLQYRRVISM